MKSSSGASVSPWMESVNFPQTTSLSKNEQADVCIIGAGIAGLTAAYLLTQEGKSVIILDDGSIAGGETSRTTAHLTNVLDMRFVELEKRHGAEGAKLAAASHTRAIELIESLVKKENINCDFKRLDGYLCFVNGESPDQIVAEADAARRAGLDGVEVLPRSPLKQFDSAPALKFPQQAQFHPLQYLNGLLAVVLKRGGRVFRAHVEKVEGGVPTHVVTDKGLTVTASSVIVATNTPFNDWVVIHTKQASYRTYVLAVRVPHGSVKEALYWDTADPYHFIRLQTAYADGYDLLLIGGEDHKTGQPPTHDPYLMLEDWALQHFPMMERIEYRWSGQIMEPIDGIAFIGRNTMDFPHVYVATGDAGQGMTHGTIAGILLTDLICGRPNEWEALYDPKRKMLNAVWEYVRENANTALQYTDWLSSGEVGSVSDIPPNSGAILRQGLHKVAVYHDNNNSFLQLSAVCPHLGGIVSWNAKEKTWDCPCHGSRFDAQGRVLNGPAANHLSVVEK